MNTKISNIDEIRATFWFHIICEVLEMPAELFLKIHRSIKNEYGDGDFHYNIRADYIYIGQYDVTVWIDKAPTYNTYLISPLITLTID